MNFDQLSEPEADRRGRSRAQLWLGLRLILQNAVPHPRLLDLPKDVRATPYGEARKALSNNLCRLQPAKWPITIAVAASLLVVLVLPHNSNAVLLDQIVAGHVRSIAMLARAWLHAQAEAQYGVLRPVLFRIHGVLEMII